MMKHTHTFLIALLLGLPAALNAEGTNENVLNVQKTEAISKQAPLPPMGWNSFDAFGSSVTEKEVLANAVYLKEMLFAHGWNTVVVDYRWSDATAAEHARNGMGGPFPLVMDAFGRLMPATNRFPSAADGKGFKGLADKIHAMGLKFGIHIMRGIPRQAVSQNTPIEASDFHAVDAAVTKSICPWCPDMYGVDATKPAGQAYYDSLFRLYASWDVDFVKVDDLSKPYRKAEIEAVRKAIDKCGRPIIFSTSPGETPVDQAQHVAANANMWRVSSDFWDRWKDLDHAFDLAARWEKIGGPGHWPDLDMIPFGRIGIRCVDGDRWTRLTRDEQTTLMSLWCLAASPLMLGMNLPDNDDWTLSLITNDEVLAVNQDPLGKPARRIFSQNGAEVWLRELKDGSKSAGLFNRGGNETGVTLNFSDAGLTDRHAIRDLWQHKDLGLLDKQITVKVPPHGSVMLKLSGGNWKSGKRPMHPE